MRFYGVHWTVDDLSGEEAPTWKDREVKTVRNLIGVLPRTFHDLAVTSSHCKQTASARNYDGSWYEARCRACKRTFKPTVHSASEPIR